MASKAVTRAKKMAAELTDEMSAWWRKGDSLVAFEASTQSFGLMSKDQHVTFIAVFKTQHWMPNQTFSVGNWSKESLSWQTKRFHPLHMSKPPETPLLHDCSYAG